MSTHKVKLRVYDLSNGKIKSLASQFNLDIEGIWHTSVEVYEREYFFQDGIVYSPKGSTSYGIPIKTIEMGETALLEDMVHEYIDQIHIKYNRNTYHLMKNNCNHFSNDLMMFLVSKPIPDYILLLPEIVKASPFYTMFLNMLGLPEDEVEDVKEAAEEEKKS
jgi:desumoylating isopeptidase 1